MPKYQCLGCKKTFLFPAKKIVNSPQTEQANIAPINDSQGVLKNYTYQATTNSVTTETKVCPHCGSIEIDEVREPEKSSEKIVAVKSAEFVEVEAMVKEGWEVEAVYSKNAVLVKKEVAQVVEKVPCPKCGSENVEETLAPFPTSSGSFVLMAWTTFRCKDCGVLYFSGEVVVKEAAKA